MIELEAETGLPEGQAVLVALGESDKNGASEQELREELDAEQALQTIYRMRQVERGRLDP
jgi:hypothetical protein